MASAAWEVDPGTGTFGDHPQDASASATIILRVKNTAGIDQLRWRCVGTHNEGSVTAATIQASMDAGLGGTPNGETVTFQLPAGSGQGYIFECVGNDGLDASRQVDSALTQTGAVFVLNSQGRRPFIQFEGEERGAGGVVPPLNVMSNSSGGGGGGGVLCTTSAQGEVNQLSGTNTVLTNPAGADGGVWAKIATANINASAITATELAAGAVTDTKIGTSAVTEAKINAGAVTATKIANDVIVNAHINSSAAIDQSKLALDITNSEINASAAIVVSKLAGGTGGYYLTTVGSTPTWTALPSIPAALSDLSDAAITTVADGQPLAYDGSNFVNISGLFFEPELMRVGTAVGTPPTTGIFLANGFRLCTEGTSGTQHDVVSTNGSSTVIFGESGLGDIDLNTATSGDLNFIFGSSTYYVFSNDHMLFRNNGSAASPSATGPRYYALTGAAYVCGSGGAKTMIAPDGTDDGSGDPPSVEYYRHREETSNATPVGVIDISLAAGETIKVRVEMMARDANDDVMDESFSFVAVRHSSGTPQGANPKIAHYTAYKDDAAWDVTIDDTVAGTITIEFTGDATQTTVADFDVKVIRSTY